MSDRLLVLVRHGQSEWNLKNLFTGWKDPDLTEKGVAEAKDAGQKLKAQGLSFDIADNSTLLAEARESAFNNAKAAAAQYAKLGGTSLSHVVSIRAIVHNASPIRAPFYDKEALAGATSAGNAGIPVRPGQKKVSVTVKVVWGLT